MLQVKNLTITHKKDLRTIIQDFSFVLNKGDKAAIIGEEGNGKSTLLKLLYQEELIEDYAQWTGEIVRNRAKIGYLAQEMTKEEKEKSVYAYISEIPLFFDCTAREVNAVARMLGLDTTFLYSEQRVGTLSGGEKVKLQLARLLLEQPDVLLLDEPTNDIDIQTLEWLEDFIKSSTLPVLYVSHDETLLEHTANIVIHIEQIKRKTESRVTVEKMGYAQYISSRMAGMARQEQVARKERSDFAKQQEKLRQIQQKVEHQQNTISRGNPHGGRLLKKKMGTIKAMEGRFERQYASFTEIPDPEEAIFIKFSNEAKVPNGKCVLDFHLEKLEIDGNILASNIELEVYGARKICITGKNGAGKSTLLKQIEHAMSARTDVRIFYMPQSYEELLDFEVTPVVFLTCTGDKEEHVRICTYLGSLKFTADEMAHPIAELSGGQKAKLLFLKMCMGDYNVLLLDEPTRNFSPLSNPVIRKLLKSTGAAIISVSHDRKYISEVCDTVYELTGKGLNEMVKINE